MRPHRWILGLLLAAGLLAACTTSEQPTATSIQTLSPSTTLPLATPTNPVQTQSPSPKQTLDTIQVVQKVMPSVVNIVTEMMSLDELLRPVPVQGAGTGIIYDTQGHIVTNNHVVQDAQEIRVTLSNGQSFPATLVGGDVFTDLAVVRIEAPEMVPAQFGSSADLRVGEEVVAIGNAFALPGGPTVTKGVVSAKGRTIQVDQGVTLEDLIQTDAAINPGNSGGPLLNMAGQVVGINSAGITGGEGLGFAISIDSARSIIDDLIQDGRVQRGLLGILPVNLTPSLARQLQVPVTKGVVIAQVVSGSPAQQAGLQPEDVIVTLGDTQVANTADLASALRGRRAGDQVQVTFYRGQQQQTVQVTLASQE